MKKTTLVLSMVILFILSLSIIYALDTSIEESAGASLPTVGPACVEILQGTMLKQAGETTFDKIIFVPKEVRIIDQNACDALRGKDYSNIAPIIPAYSLDQLLIPVPENVPTTITSKILLSYNDFYDGLAKNTEKINAKAKATIEPNLISSLKSMNTTNQNMIVLSSTSKALFTANKLAFPNPTKSKNTGEVFLSLLPQTPSASGHYTEFSFKKMILKSSLEESIDFKSFKINTNNQDAMLTLDEVTYESDREVHLQSDKKVDFYLDINDPKGLIKDGSKTDYSFNQVKELIFDTQNKEWFSIYLRTDGLDVSKPTSIYYYLPNKCVIFPDRKGEVDAFIFVKGDESAVKGLLSEEIKGFVIFTPKKILSDGFKKLEIQGSEIKDITLKQGDSLYYGYPNELNVIKNLEQQPLEFGFGSSDKMLRFKNDGAIEVATSKGAENDILFTFNDFPISLEKGVNKQNTQLSLIPATTQTPLVTTSEIVGNAAHKDKLVLSSEVDQLIIYPTGAKEKIGPYTLYFKFEEKERIINLFQAAEKLELVQKEKDTTRQKELVRALPKVEIPASTTPKIEEVKTKEVTIIKAKTISVPDSCKTTFIGYACIKPTGKEITESITTAGDYKYECKIDKVCKDSSGNKVWCCSGGFETRCCKKTALKLPSTGDRLQLPKESIENNLKEQIKTNEKIFPSDGKINLRNFKVEYPKADATSTTAYKPDLKLGTGYTFLNEFKANGKTYYTVQNPEGKVLNIDTKENGDPDMAPSLYGAIAPMQTGNNAEQNKKIKSTIESYKSSYGTTANILDAGMGNGPRFKIAKWEFIMDEEFDRNKGEYTFPLYKVRYQIFKGDTKGAYVGRLIKDGNGLKIEIANFGGTYVNLGFNEIDYKILSNTKIGISSSDANDVWRGPGPALKFGQITYPTF